ncbi:MULTISPECIES: PEP-CTERM sorting domain-containing protein [unclassified Agarivorans]|uniref:PEP-CTERM sorting domain-containing protein n=1 Tax=unclassified Agarivorans TaxID=2636026 RepID=UPI003D7E5B5A
MKASILFLLISLTTFNTSATIITASENPSVPAGPVVYLGGYPTPQQDPSSGAVPSPASVIDIDDDIRAAVSFDLQSLNRLSDEGTGGFANGLFDITFYWYFGGFEQAFSYMYSAWDDIETWQASGSGLLSYWSDDYIASNDILEVGEWTVYAYAEQTYVGGTTFSVTSVPEPGSLVLFALVMVGLFTRRGLPFQN